MLLLILLPMTDECVQVKAVEAEEMVTARFIAKRAAIAEEERLTLERTKKRIFDSPKIGSACATQRSKGETFNQ